MSEPEAIDVLQRHLPRLLKQSEHLEKPYLTLLIERAYAQVLRASQKPANDREGGRKKR